jgi:hypothetical protein
MAAKRDQWAENLSASQQSGWLTSFVADEGPFDRHAKWRLASWAICAVAAFAVAVLAGQHSLSLRREQLASADLLDRQSLQIQQVAKETETESKRLSAAINTLNGDRDRLFARVTSVEQGLDAVTGSIKRPTASAPISPSAALALETPLVPQKSPPAVHPALAAAPAALPTANSVPLIGPVASAVPEPAPSQPMAPVTSIEAPAPLLASKSMWAAPEPAAAKLTEPAVAPPSAPLAPAPSIHAGAAHSPETTASVEPAPSQPAASQPAKSELVSIPVQRTEFGVDLGGANTVEGLRALWRGLAASNKALASLRPIMTIRERTGGYGMQLRLVAGPLDDAASAATLCAGLKMGSRSCETSVFDGQRLALRNESPPKPEAVPATIPAVTKPVALIAKPAPARRRTSNVRPEPVREPVAEQAPVKPPEEPPPPAPPPKPAGLSAILGMR